MSELIPADTYLGKAVEGTLKAIVSDKKSTPGFEGQVEITQKGPHQGKRFLWRGWTGENTAERTFEQLMAAGCTFPNDDTTNVAGWGSTSDLALVIGVEEATTGDDGKQYAERRRCEWINEGLGGRGVTAVDTSDAAAKAAFNAAGKGALAAVRARKSGKGANGGAPAVADGIPRDAAGKARF